MFALLPVGVPIEVSGKFVCGKEGEPFWRKSAQSSWPQLNVREHGSSWKRLYFERTCRATLEKHTADAPLEKLEAFLMACRDHVYSLRIGQLHSHVPLSFVCNSLVNLTALHLTYGTHKVGVDLDWSATIGMNMGDCKSLCRALKHTRTLSTLSLSDNSISDELLAAMGEGFAENRTITSLDLSHNHITSVGAIDLVSRICTPADSVIVKLVLANNLIGQEAAPALGKVAASCPSLEWLDIGMNNLAASIAEVLNGAASSSSLVHISVASNSVLEQQAPAVASALASLTATRCPQTLETVSMYGTPLGEPGGAAVLQALQRLPGPPGSLAEIDLRCCNVSKATIDAIDAILSKGREARRRRPGTAAAPSSK